MSATIRNFRGVVGTYQPGLLLVAIVLVLGWIVQWLVGAAPHSERDMLSAINRVYNLNAQPMMVVPARTPPTR